MLASPDIQDFTYLSLLAQHHSIALAATQAGVTPAAFSAVITALEQKLSTKLIEARGDTIVFTAQGDDVLLRSRKILADLDALVRACEISSAPLSGQLRLGVIPTVAPFLLPSLLKQLRHDYPHLRLVIREEHASTLMDSLHSGKLDAVIAALPIHGASIEAQLICEDALLLACLPQHYLLQKPELFAHDIMQHELLLLEEGYCLRNQVLALCQFDNAAGEFPYHAGSLSTLVQMVANGIGVTLLPQLAVANHILNGTDVITRSFNRGAVSRQIALVWHQHSERADEFGLFANYLSDIFGKQVH